MNKQDEILRWIDKTLNKIHRKGQIYGIKHHRLWCKIGMILGIVVILVILGAKKFFSGYTKVK